MGTYPMGASGRVIIGNRRSERLRNKKAKKSKSKKNKSKSREPPEEGELISEPHPLVTVSKINPDEIPEDPGNRFLSRDNRDSRDSKRRDSRDSDRRNSNSDRRDSNSDRKSRRDDRREDYRRPSK